MKTWAARGGEAAIANSERLFRERLGGIARDQVNSIERSMPYLIDRVMSEASLYAPELAALALVQSGGDLSEAVLLLRAYRTTQPRIAYARPVDPGDFFTVRRISAAFKDIPGGQILGPSLDYSHRLLRTEVLTAGDLACEPVVPAEVPSPAKLPSLADWQRKAGLIAETADGPDHATGRSIPDLTREPLLFPASRAHTLQSLARADTGGTMALGYANMRGYGAVHPTVNELRLGEAELVLDHPRGGTFSAGRVRVSQAEIVSQSDASASTPLTLGFSATLGWNETKVIAGGTLDLAMRQNASHPAATPEFVLYHTEPADAAGMCQHYKLPHYVTFLSALDAVLGVRREAAGGDDGSDQASTTSELEEVE